MYKKENCSVYCYYYGVGGDDMSTNRLLSKNERSSTHVHMDEQNAVCVLANKLKNMVDRYKQRDLIVLCIGTDRSTGDALGPLVGSMLQKEYMRHFHIYGTLEKPIHAVNLKDEIIKIKKTHPFSYIIAIDACLGRLANVGNITIADGPVKPGAAV